MSRRAHRAGSIITLLTDFGSRDSYVAEMKLALLRRAPTARLIDVTHAIDPQDVLGASIQLARVIAAADAGTFHLAVVDPGVGSDRRILLVKLAGQTIVCPDNGLITWPWRRLGPGKAFAMHWRPRNYRATFHGRDIMAPALARLAAGSPLSTLAQPIDDPILLELYPADGAGQVIHIDRFGNATTNLPVDSVAGHHTVRIGRRAISIRNIYSDVVPGKPLALIGSAGLLEIAVRNGSAAHTLGLKVGDEVKLAG